MEPILLSGFLQDEGFFQGKIEHAVGQVHRFKDFKEMLLLIQGKLDRLGYPAELNYAAGQISF